MKHAKLAHPKIYSPEIYYNFLFLFLIWFFYWRIITLQNFVVFCQTSIWCIYPLPFEPLSHLHPHTTPLGWYRAAVWVSWDYSKFPLAIYFAHGNISFHVTLSIHLTLSSPLPTSISLFYVCFSIAALQTNSSVPFFLDSIYMH